MKIVVTGGNGMIGKTIKKMIDMCGNYIKDSSGNTKHEFVFATREMCDLSNKEDTDAFFKNGNFDFIIHLAAYVGGLYKKIENNVDFFMDNVKINKNVLEACFSNNVVSGIFCLSSCVYPKNPADGFPMRENLVNTGEPHFSSEGYAYSKRLLFLMCDQYNNMHKTNYVCVVPVNLYGPFDRFNTYGGHVVPELIKRLHNVALNKEGNESVLSSLIPKNKFEIYGSGDTMRQFLYSEDFARVILLFALEKDISEVPKLINISGNNCEIKIKELAKMILSLFKEKNIIQKYTYLSYDTEYYDGVMQKTVCNCLLGNTIGNDEIEKFTTIKDGLRLTIDWYIKSLE